MKLNTKILAALCYGAVSVSLADTQDITFQNTDQGHTPEIFNTTGDWSISAVDVTVNPTTWSNPTDNSNGGLLRPTVGTSVLCPNVRIDYGTTNSWTISITLENTSGNELSINSLTLSGLTAYALDGSLQGGPRAIDITLAGGDFSAENASVSLANATDRGEHRTTFDVDRNITVDAGSSATLTLTADNATFYQNGSNTLVGFNGMSIDYSATPEPTSATLSLLALAGLCARRRRK